MARDYPEPYHEGLQYVYVVLDKLSEEVTGIEAWAVSLVIGAVETALEAADEKHAERREAEIDAEAEQLVEKMIEAVAAVEEGDS